MKPNALMLTNCTLLLSATKILLLIWSYFVLQVVTESLTKSFELSVTALIVTPRTFGARVALTETQLKLWPEGADKEGVAPALLASVEALPVGSRAHVTLGCSAGVESVQTGLDLLEILALQKEGKEGTQVVMDVGTLTYLSEGRWFLALREPITADTTFTSFSDDKPTGDQGKKDGEKKKKKCTILWAQTEEEEKRGGGGNRHFS